MAHIKGENLGKQTQQLLRTREHRQYCTASSSGGAVLFRPWWSLCSQCDGPELPEIAVVLGAGRPGFCTAFQKETSGPDTFL